MISIIIPTYQHEKEIGKCISSILSQTFKDYEIIIVNDGSTDNTLKVLENYKSTLGGKIKIINQENRGACAARNRGFKESSGEFVLFCDADVVLRQNMLEKLLKALKENSDKSYAYPSFKFGWKKFKAGEFDKEKLKKINYIHTSALIRRRNFPGFDESLKKFQDWDLWLTMSEHNYYGIWVKDILFKIKPRQNGISHWLPSFFYKAPFKNLGICSKIINDYEKSKVIINKKHNL